MDNLQTRIKQWQDKTVLLGWTRGEFADFVDRLLAENERLKAQPQISKAEGADCKTTHYACNCVLRENERLRHEQGRLGRDIMSFIDMKKILKSKLAIAVDALNKIVRGQWPEVKDRDLVGIATDALKKIETREGM